MSVAQAIWAQGSGTLNSHFRLSNPIPADDNVNVENAGAPVDPLAAAASAAASRRGRGAEGTANVCSRTPPGGVVRTGGASRSYVADTSGGKKPDADSDGEVQYKKSAAIGRCLQRALPELKSGVLGDVANIIKPLRIKMLVKHYFSSEFFKRASRMNTSASKRGNVHNIVQPCVFPSMLTRLHANTTYKMHPHRHLRSSEI